MVSLVAEEGGDRAEGKNGAGDQLRASLDSASREALQNTPLI